MIHDSDWPDWLQYFTAREVRWAWRYISKRDREQREDITKPAGGQVWGTRRLEEPLPDINQTPESILKDKLAEYASTLLHPKQAVTELLNARRDRLVDERYLKRVKANNHRLLIWLLSEISQRDELSLELSSINPEDRRDYFILYLDQDLSLTKEQKKQWLDNCISEWATTARTSDASTNWLDFKNRNQLAWAATYLTSKRVALDLPAPISIDDQSTLILTSFDAAFRGQAAEKTLFTIKMKQAWSQKKYRDSGKGKKSVYIRKSVHDKLDRLASANNQTPAEFIAQLIESCPERTVANEV